MVSEYRIRPRDAAAEKIECYIIQNGLNAHDRLPSERAMCEMWGFNRTTLRSAIHRLCMEGVLYSRMGSGTFVSPPKLVRNLQDIVPFGRAVQDAGHKPGTVLVAQSVREANKQISKKLHVTLGRKVMQLVRVRYMDDIPVLLETSYVDAQRFPGIEENDFGSKSLYATLENEYGVQLHRGVEKLNVTYVDGEEAALLQMEEGAPAIYQSGVIYDDGDTPVEHFKSIARSEYIQFASVLTR